MSFGFSGGFWPMGLPLFHASRFSMTAMIDSLVINRSLIFRFGEKRLLSEIMLYACCRPQPVSGDISPKQTVAICIRRVSIQSDLSATRIVAAT
jgi:hypothetical protein